MTRVFIDGQAGTTGLDLHGRLRERTDLELIEIDPAERKSAAARTDCIRSADVVFACLPDDAARETAALAAAHDTRIIDASSAHRTDADWVYGLPELAPEQRDRIRNAARVANPGCYPTGLLLLVRPLIDAGLLPAETPLKLQGLSGCSGGGRGLIDAWADDPPLGTRPYALGLDHKHLPEMHAFSGLAAAPLFTPMVGPWYAGMIDFVPLHRSELAHAQVDATAIMNCWRERYRNEPLLTLCADEAVRARLADRGQLEPDALSGRDDCELMVVENTTQLLLIARYDNLGKGASGAAVQNLNLMIGAPETAGLRLPTDAPFTP